MKYLLLVAIVIGTMATQAFMPCAIIPIPNEVKTAFAQRFPAITKVKWGKEQDGNYEAHFKIVNKNISATFSPTGYWIETESEINLSQLPMPVLAAFKKRVGQRRLPKSVGKIETPLKEVLYEVEYHVGLIVHELFYDETGQEVTNK